jgi:O-acetylserine/cysteine efflux transporter
MPLSHLLLLLMVCFIWAGNFIISAWAVQYLEPVTYTVVRFAMVFLLIFPLLRPPAPGQWRKLIATCWSVGALHFAFLFMALGRSQDVSSVALLMQVYIPISTVFAVMFLGERIGWRTSSGIALSFSGVLVMGFDPLMLAQLDVLLLVLLSAIALGAGTIMMRQLKDVSVMNFQAWNALFAFLPLTALALWLESPVETVIESVEAFPKVWAAVAYSSIGASIVGHGTFYWLVQRHEVNKLLPVLLLIPVLAVLMGVLFWGDRPGPRLLLGGGLVLSGVLWITLRARWRRVVRPETPPAI